MSSRFGSTSLRQNSSAVRAIAWCSSVRSSGVKISSGVRSSIRNAPPCVFGSVTVAVAISLDPLENSGGALATADAHRHHSVFCFPALHFAEDGGREFRSGAAERVAEGDCSAVEVDLLRIQAGAPDHRQRLHGERFVQFDNINVFE